MLLPHHLITKNANYTLIAKQPRENQSSVLRLAASFGPPPPTQSSRTCPPGGDRPSCPCSAAEPVAEAAATVAAALWRQLAASYRRRRKLSPRHGKDGRAETMTTTMSQRPSAVTAAPVAAAAARGRRHSDAGTSCRWPSPPARFRLCQDNITLSPYYFAARPCSCLMVWSDCNLILFHDVS